jgi:hypothetical protein
VQFEIVRKFRAAASNIYHSSVDGQRAMVMAKDTRKLQVTKCPTYSDYFESFHHGMHKWMGDIIIPDQALLHDILKEVMLILEEEWGRVQERKKLDSALEGMFYILGFTLVLRGEEMPLMELQGIIKHWDQGQQHSKPHVVITLSGRFKSELW